ncbi:O-antigen ligase family protein [Guyparkeria hydrothermalis]|uniref:O-antigen ligase family protein n=1 Tax=Guyparkeria hydrothermalis TaxID=923 RepID=UPI002020FE30|nr:O-antigen ligase family protein [Guyparkeria hydrothermalis]MCL7743692.1 O-antigen ligase family protein [Guyparkeria hydrothermalis]
MPFLPKTDVRISPKWDGWSWSIVGLFTLVIVTLPFGRSVNAPLALLALVAIWLLATRWKEVLGRPAIRWLLVLIAAIWAPQLLALLGAENFDRALNTAAYYPFYGLAALPVVWAATRHDVTPVLLNIVLAASLFWAIDGLIQFFLGSNLLGFPYNERRLTGMFHPNLTMGVVMAQLLPLVLEATRRLMHRHWAWGVALLPILMTIVLTGSRSAMLVMGLAVLAYGGLVVWRYRVRWQWIAAAVLGVVLAISAVLAVSPQTRDRVMVTAKVFDMDREAFNAATAMRGDVWIAGWQLVQDAPWTGVGVRGFEALAVDRGYSEVRYTHLHLFAMDVQVSTGLVGLAAYLLGYLLFVAFLWRSGGDRMVGGASVIAVGLALWPLNTHFGFYASYTLAVVWPIIGLATALVVRRESGKRVGDQVD